MINFELGQRWAKNLKRPDAYKTVRVLTRLMDDGKECDCCLGDACKLFGVPRKLYKSEDSTGIKYFTYNGSNTALPSILAIQLNITKSGSFKSQATDIAQLWWSNVNPDVDVLVEDCGGLININDIVAHDEPTLFNIGSFIEHLMVLEYLFNIECFMSYSGL